MTKHTIPTAILSVAFILGAAAPSKASELYATSSIAEYQSPIGYDFSSLANDPPTTYQNIGTFTFTPIAAVDVSGITISGTFGNEDFGQTTALSDYFLGDATDGEEAVSLIGCDSTLINPQPDCYAGQEGPYAWSVTLGAAQIADLASGLAAGSIDFGYTWGQNAQPISDPFFGDSNGDDLQYVEAGQTTLDVLTPEPSTFLFCFSGFAAIAALRRFRRV